MILRQPSAQLGDVFPDAQIPTRSAAYRASRETSLRLPSAHESAARAPREALAYSRSAHPPSVAPIEAGIITHGGPPRILHGRRSRRLTENDLCSRQGSADLLHRMANHAARELFKSPEIRPRFIYRLPKAAGRFTVTTSITRSTRGVLFKYIPKA